MLHRLRGLQHLLYHGLRALWVYVLVAAIPLARFLGLRCAAAATPLFSCPFSRVRTPARLDSAVTAPFSRNIFFCLGFAHITRTGCAYRALRTVLWIFTSLFSFLLHHIYASHLLHVATLTPFLLDAPRGCTPGGLPRSSRTCLLLLRHAVPLVCANATGPHAPHKVLLRALVHRFHNGLDLSRAAVGLPAARTPLNSFSFCSRCAPALLDHGFSCTPRTLPAPRARITRFAAHLRSRLDRHPVIPHRGLRAHLDRSSTRAFLCTPLRHAGFRTAFVVLVCILGSHLDWTLTTYVTWTRLRVPAHLLACAFSDALANKFLHTHATPTIMGSPLCTTRSDRALHLRLPTLTAPSRMRTYHCFTRLVLLLRARAFYAPGPHAAPDALV